jgi:hypothetical protein
MLIRFNNNKHPVGMQTLTNYVSVKPPLRRARVATQSAATTSYAVKCLIFVTLFHFVPLLYVRSVPKKVYYGTVGTYRYVAAWENERLASSRLQKQTKTTALVNIATSSECPWMRSLYIKSHLDDEGSQLGRYEGWQSQ